MNKNTLVNRFFKIEKRNNSPNVIYFQHCEQDGFFAPKFIYVAFSPDGKKEYKAQSRDEIVNFIIQNVNDIEFMRNNPDCSRSFYAR